MYHQTDMFRFSLGQIRSVIFSLLLIAMLMPLSVFAQSSSDVNQQLNSISRQLRALQEIVLQQTGQTPDREGGYSVDGSLLADMEVRLGAIDREFRLLTGSVEEMGYRQRQLETKFENFKADIELRFQDLGGATYETAQDNQQSSIVDEIADEGEAPVLVAEQNGDVAVDTLEPIVETESPVTLTTATPEESYELAFGFLRRGDYQGAENAFIDFLELYSEHELAGNAQYWLAETYYARRDYINAAANFLEGYQKYNDGAKATDSLLKLGMSLAAMDQVEEACLAFSDIAIRHADASENLLNSAKRANNC